MVFTILLVIISACIITLAVVTVPKFSRLSALDLDHFPKAKTKVVKAQLAEERLQRQLMKRVRKFVEWSAPVTTRVRAIAVQLWRNVVRNLERLEEQYRQKLQRVNTGNVTCRSG